MFTVNEIVSKPLQIEPLKDGEVKEFIHANAGVYDPSSTKKLATPQGYTTPGQCTIKDPHDPKHSQKLILNIISYSPKRKEDGTTFFDPVIDYVRFPSTGRITCSLEKGNFDEYCFLRLNNKNGTNTNRMKSVAVKYYELQEVVAKAVKVQRNAFEYRTIAGNILMTASLEDLFKIGYAANKNPELEIAVDLNSGEDGMKAALAKLAEKRPEELIKLSSDKRAILRLAVDFAIEDGDIKFNEHESERKWFWFRGAGEKGPKTICKVEVGVPPVTALVDYLLTAEGGVHLAEVKQRYQNYAVTA